MSDEDAPQYEDNPLIVIGDKIQPEAHLVALLQQLRAENNALTADGRIKYAVCKDSTEVALALRRYLDNVKMVLIGPGLTGNAIAVARMLSKKVKIVIVINPRKNPLGTSLEAIKATQKNLEHLGIIIVDFKVADSEFFAPIVKDYVISGMSVGVDLESLSPEERGSMIDARLNAVDKFPSLPETQRKVAELDDMDSPRKWAEAIDSDVPMRTVILRLLNSARYGFRARVETIEQAVALASARTIREIVTACQMRQILRNTNERTIDQYWRHSLAAAFYAKLFVLPADPTQQSPQHRNELDRYQLEDDQLEGLRQAALWTRFDLHEKDDPFTSGLLHDIGKITMIICLEDSLQLINAVIESEVKEAEEGGHLWAHSTLAIERFLMQDIDHQIIGARLAEKWELPPALIQVIGHHHNVSENSPHLLKLIALANLASNCLFPYPGEEHHPFPHIFAQIDAAIKSKAGMGFDEAVEQAIGQDCLEALAGALERLEVPDCLWQLIDFRQFFKICYLTAPKIKSASIAFLQQTA